MPALPDRVIAPPKSLSSLQTGDVDQRQHPGDRRQVRREVLQPRLPPDSEERLLRPDLEWHHERAGPRTALPRADRLYRRRFHAAGPGESKRNARRRPPGSGSGPAPR